VVCSVEDRSGNAATCSFVVIVKDVQVPDVECPITAVVDALGNTSIVVPFTATAEDVVDGIVTPTCTPASNSSFELGSTTVTCSASDASGNRGSCEFDVFVFDSVNGALACPDDVISRPLDGEASVAVDYDLPTVEQGTVTCSPAAGTSFLSGATGVTCRQTNSNSQLIGLCVFIVSVADVLSPAITCPSNARATTSVGLATGQARFPLPIAQDSVDGVVAASCDAAAGPFPLGDTAVNCQAADIAGNQANCTFNVTVVDEEKPTFGSCLAVRSVKLPLGQSTMPVTWDLQAMDNSLSDPTVTCSEASGTAFAVGEHLISCQASDPAANLAQCIFTIRVSQDCDSSWSAWSSCSTCQARTPRTRSRLPLITAQPQFGGAACPTRQGQSCGDVDSCGQVEATLTLSSIDLNALALHRSRARAALVQFYVTQLIDRVDDGSILIGEENVGVTFSTSRREVGDAQAEVTVGVVEADMDAVIQALDVMRSDGATLQELVDAIITPTPVVTAETTAQQSASRRVLSAADDTTAAPNQQGSQSGSSSRFPIGSIIGIIAAVVAIAILAIIVVFRRQADNTPVVLSRTGTHRSSGTKSDLFQRRSTHRNSSAFLGGSTLYDNPQDTRREEENVNMDMFSKETVSQHYMERTMPWDSLHLSRNDCTDLNLSWYC